MEALVLGFFKEGALSLRVCAFTLTWVMGQRYIQTSKIMPAGIVALISHLGVLTSEPGNFSSMAEFGLTVFPKISVHLCTVMTGFFLFKIATGGNHIPAKAE
ncbi:hypothetical protein HHK36_031961 [Tetracentron sinense]|uniref:Uncharacterized protein n=1 Tax=Tetracentron sinense TaxID=13715 RepID=A0A834YB41_TETSI|nr:hypothetical protein HHK36_031961 [Tetracentron sinense]